MIQARSPVDRIVRMVGLDVGDGTGGRWRSLRWTFAVCLASLLVLWAEPGASADRFQYIVVVNFDPCDAAPLDQIKRIVGIELKTLFDRSFVDPDFDIVEGDDPIIRVRARCEGDRATITVQVVGETVERILELGETKKKGRARLVALAVSEEAVVGRDRSEHLRYKRTKEALPVLSSGIESGIREGVVAATHFGLLQGASEWVDAALRAANERSRYWEPPPPPAKTILSLEFGPVFFDPFSSLSGRSDSSSPATWGVGGGGDISVNSWLNLRLGLDWSGGDVDTSLGNASMSALSTTIGLGPRWESDFFAACAMAGYRLGTLAIEPLDAGVEDRIQSPVDGLWGGPFLSIGGDIFPNTWHGLRLTTELGYASGSAEAMVDGEVELGVVGPWVLVRLGARVDLLF